MARWRKKKKDFNAEKIYKFFGLFSSLSKLLADVKTVFSPSSSFTNNWNIIVAFVVCFLDIFSLIHWIYVVYRLCVIFTKLKIFSPRARRIN